MNNTARTMELTSAEIQDLKKAKALLDNPGLAVKLSDLIGMPLEKAMGNLPEKWNQKVEEIIQTALKKAVDAAASSLKADPGKTSSDKWHKLSVAVTGGLGGIFGLPALSVELPLSTTIIMRSIVDIARSEGENIKDEQTKLACLEVFALGGTNTKDDAAEFGYYGVRAGLAYSAKGVTEKGAALLARFISVIAKRFSSSVLHKISAQAVPIVGAAGGAIINTIFMDHYQDMARGHFIVRRLERKYSQEKVSQLYKTL